MGFVVLRTAKPILSKHQFTSGFFSRVLVNCFALCGNLEKGCNPAGSLK